MKNHEIALCLFEAKDRGILDDLTPDHFRVSFSETNYGACGIQIDLVLDGLEPLDIWNKGVLPDGGFALQGIQPGCEFAQSPLSVFFLRVKQRLDEIKEAERQQKAFEAAVAKKKRVEHIEEAKLRLSVPH